METILNFINQNKTITFIGMPGAGKSFTSNFFSNKYNIPVLELDMIIEKKYNKTLPEIIQIYGENELKNIESNTVLDITFNKTKMISPGGSIIYSEKSMKHLQNPNNVIIYLKTDFEILKERTENFTNRGIIFNGLTPIELFKNRCILYEKYADITIDTKNLILT